MGRWNCFRPAATLGSTSADAKPAEPCRLLALPEPITQLILDQLPGNEALAVGASCRALQEAVQRMQGMHAQVTLIASRGHISFSTASNKIPTKACKARSFRKFLGSGGVGMLASLTVRVVPASETLFSEFIGTHLYHPAPSCMWEPLARLKRLTIIVEHGNVGNTFSDILRGCSSLTSLRLSLPGHWDTKYLFRESGLAELKSLQDLTIETQRLSFYTAFAPPTAGPTDAPLARLRLVAQELAMYGSAQPVTAGVQSMELVVGNLLHYADGQALQRLLDGRDAGLQMRLDPGALRPFAKRSNMSAAALAEEQVLAESVLDMCEPAREPAMTAVAA